MAHPPPAKEETSTMGTTRPRATRDEVNRAIREIEAYHRHGRQSLKEMPRRGRYGEGDIAGQVKRLREKEPGTHWSHTRIRKARQFADPEGGYSRRQLDHLYRLLRKHLPVFGVSHVGILVTLGWAEGRAELQRRCVVSNWSKAELEAAVMRRLGPRRQGVRWRQVGEEAGHLLPQLDAMAQSWERWYGVANGTLGKAGRRRNVLPKLPPAIRKRVKAITGAMAGLRAKVAEKLREIRAGETGR